MMPLNNASPAFEQRYASHLKHLKLRGLQAKTVDAYARAIRTMGEHFDWQIDTLSEDQLTDYFHQRIASHSWSAVKLDLYGYKFYVVHVLRQPWAMPELIRPPKTSRLPDIVTVEQAQALFGATRTLSYRVFFFTVYSLGLRLSEGLALSVADIDAERERVQIRDSKGNRDRFVPLPAATLVVLRRFWQEHRNPELLLPNRHGGLLAAARARTPLDRGGVQRALRRSSPNQWVEAGKPSIVDRASRKLETILATHYPTHIPTAVDDAIRVKFPVRLAREAMRPPVHTQVL